MKKEKFFSGCRLSLASLRAPTERSLFFAAAYERLALRNVSFSVLFSGDKTLVVWTRGARELKQRLRRRRRERTEEEGGHTRSKTSFTFPFFFPHFALTFILRRSAVLVEAVRRQRHLHWHGRGRISLHLPAWIHRGKLPPEARTLPRRRVTALLSLSLSVPWRSRLARFRVTLQPQYETFVQPRLSADVVQTSSKSTKSLYCF